MILKNCKITQKQFYLLSFTWGIIMTSIGCIISLVLIIIGKKPKKNQYGWYFEIGNGSSGSEFGCMCIVHKNPSQYLLDHEFGHAVQNCIFGPGMVFITLASAIRYHYRKIAFKRGKFNLPGYDDIWFEGQATKLGEYYRTH